MNDEEILKKPYKEKWFRWSEKGKQEARQKDSLDLIKLMPTLLSADLILNINKYSKEEIKERLSNIEKTKSLCDKIKKLEVKE